MRLVEQWNAIEQGLDPRWSDARLVLTIDDETQPRRALALLAPAGPGRAGNAIRFYATRARRRCSDPKRCDDICAGSTTKASAAAELVVVRRRAGAPPRSRARRLAAEWDAALAALPGDWSDLLCELELTSSDHIERAALLARPDQSGAGGTDARASASGARTASATARRPAWCAAASRGSTRTPSAADMRIARALSDVHPVGTQGATFLVGRRPA